MADLNKVTGMGMMIDSLFGNANSGLKHLVGHKVVGVYKDGDGDFAFALDDDTYVTGSPEGDCCSYTWVEHVSGVKELVGKEIVSFTENTEFDSHENVDETPYDCLALYGISLHTEDGHQIDIDYRNDSNGYYGGWLNWDLSDGTPEKDWRLITEDF